MRCKDKILCTKLQKNMKSILSQTNELREVYINYDDDKDIRYINVHPVKASY